MKVVFAHTDFRLYWPVRLRRLREYLQECGVELQVVEIAGKGSPYAFAGRSDPGGDGWRCLFPEAAMEEIEPRRACGALFGALDELQPDVVFAGALAFPSGATALRWARRRNRRVVIFDDARRMDVPRNWLVNAVKRRLFAQADAWLLPAPSHMADYEFWGVSRERMFFGVDVVDNDFFARHADAARQEAARWRQELELPDRFVLGVGRQVPKKNWTRLLEAWEAAALAGWSLVLIGNGPDRNRLEALASDRVLFRDFVSQERLAVYYGLASALILPSLRGETWGLVVNEAMAAGLPVLVSRQCGCAATLVEPGGNGWVFDAWRTEEMVTVLRACMSSTELKRMGHRSRQIIADWGLPRFCEGAWSAWQCAMQSPPQRATVADRLLLGFWNGRYRPL